ncbi:hypothetical protein BGX21_007496 [Mortierella sp. AD011]|nr:hypothetical protein BGX20_007866 [Mortierella sp. AD010]KAF9403029.1 hypothetical protein BGX21_007496 [Mortierella sp. AD011]
MPVTPTKQTNRQSRSSHDEGSSREYSFTSPSRSRSALGTASKFTTVDNLLLPGVIGTTVEGPKTPFRSPSARRSVNHFPGANINNNKSSNGHINALPVSPRISREGIMDSQSQTSQQSNNNVAPSRYIDTEVDIPHGNHSNREHFLTNGASFGTPQGKQYRKTFRPHDTPIAHSKKSSRHNNHLNSNGRESDGLTLTSAYYYPNTQVGGYASGMDQSEDDKENDPTRAPLTPQKNKTSQFFYSDTLEREQNHGTYTKSTGHDPYQEDQYQTRHISSDDDDDVLNQISSYNTKAFAGSGDSYVDEALDIGGYEDELYPNERLSTSVYPDPGMDGEEVTDSDVDQDELAREAEELKREQEQLGFIKRVANLLRRQRDEYGWGTPRRSEKHVDLSDSDSDRFLTSARVRRGSFKRRSSDQVSKPSKSSIALVLPRTITPTAHHAAATPPAVPRTVTPPITRRTVTPPAIRRTATPTAIRRTTTPPAIRRAATPPAVVPSYDTRKSDIFSVPTMRQLDSGIGMNSSQNSEEDEYEGEDDELAHWEPTRSPRISSARTRETKNERYREIKPEEPEYASAEIEADHPTSYGMSSRRHHRPNRVYHQEHVYPWHVIWRMIQQGTRQFRDLLLGALETLQFILLLIISWAHSVLMWPWQQRHTVWSVGESWVRTGVSMGLLSPGTLVGVGFLCLAVWVGHSLGFTGTSSQNCESSLVCKGETVSRNLSEGTSLEGMITDTWDKLSGRKSTDGTLKSHSWTNWIPQLPSISNWIPLRDGKKSTPHRISIPAEDIHSLEDLESAIKWIQKTLVELGNADEQLSNELQTKFNGMTVRISGVEHKLSEVSDEVNSLKQYVRDGRWIEQTVMELIRDEIPNHLVVSRDAKTGKLSIPGDFWNTARELFMTSEQVQKSINDRLLQLGLEPENQQEPSSGGWRWGSSKPGGRKSERIISWDDFLRENERALSDFVEGRLSKVSRSEFLGLVRTEANTIWQGLEKNVVALLEKQGKLQGKDAPRKSSYGSSSASDSNNGRALTDVERELISHLIDEALEKYSADAMATPDYALFSAGGRIIPRLTSNDYHHPVQPTFWGRIGLRYIVPLPKREKPAEKAIEPGLHAGECWAMDGQKGQLAIRLARKIIVTGITIEHADPSIVLDMDSAAKEVDIWSLRGSEDAAPASGSPAHVSISQNNDVVEPTTEEAQDSPWPGAVFLTTVEYLAKADDTKPKARQTFSIPLSKQTSPSVGVVLQIKSNWGHPNYTCLYRVRVHGYEPTA